MNTLPLCLILIIAIASHDATSLLKDAQKLTLTGRVTLPAGSRIPVEAGAKLTVELQDTSLVDAPAKTIARGTNKVIRFPVAFTIKYLSKQISDKNTYSLHAAIKNKKGELLYINDVRIGVTPTGANRTKSIDVPVILVKQIKSIFDDRKWPELVGKNGQEAVRIIKKETGFTNVMTIQEGSPITLDLRTDRVRVFVNNKGIVTIVPSVA